MGDVAAGRQEEHDTWSEDKRWEPQTHRVRAGLHACCLQATIAAATSKSPALQPRCRLLGVTPPGQTFLVQEGCDTYTVCCVPAHHKELLFLGEPRPRARFTATPAPASSASTGRWRPCGALAAFSVCRSGFEARGFFVAVHVCTGAHLRRPGERLQSGLQRRAGACRAETSSRSHPMSRRRWSATSAAPAASRKRAAAIRARAPIPTTAPRLQLIAVAGQRDMGAGRAAVR